MVVITPAIVSAVRGTWAATQWKTTTHVIWIPPSCQHRHGWTRRQNKLDFLTTSDFTKRPQLRATDKRYGSHKLSSFWCSNLPGKTDIRTRVRRKSKWTTGGYCALRRCGCSRRGKGTQFQCLNFACDRLASRLYAATATTFLMKIYGYCVCDSEWFPFFSNVWLLMIFFLLIRKLNDNNISLLDMKTNLKVHMTMTLYTTLLTCAQTMQYNNHMHRTVQFIDAWGGCMQFKGWCHPYDVHNPDTQYEVWMAGWSIIIPPYSTCKTCIWRIYCTRKNSHLRMADPTAA